METGLVDGREPDNLATRIVFKQQIDIAIDGLFDVAESPDAIKERFPRHELVVVDLDSK